MANYNKKPSYNKGNNTNTTPRILPITKTLPLVVTGRDNRDMEYNADQALEIVTHLQNCNVFDILSVNATLAKSICFNDAEAKGQIGVARIKSYNPENGDIELLFLGKNTAYADLVDDMVIVPRVRTNRDGNVESVLSFDIVPAMEA